MPDNVITTFDSIDIQSKLKEPRDGLHFVYADATPDNLINSAELLVGKYVNNQGVETSGTGWNLTPYLDISDNGGNIYALNCGLSAYYDSNKTFISSITPADGPYGIPTNAVYIRCSILDANVNTAILSTKPWFKNGLFTPTAFWTDKKKEYDRDFVIFTVPVNNTVANTSETSISVNAEGTPNYVDVECALKLPYEYQPIGHPCKLLMLCHGAGRGVTGASGWLENANYLRLVEMFTSRGYAVFDCNGFANDALGESFWGNPRGVEAWRKAYNYVVDNYNVEKTFSIYAFSMGGLTAMQLAFTGFPNINSIAMGSPVLNLRRVWDSTDGTKNVIKTLYGMGDTWDDSKVVGCDPYKHIIDQDGVLYCPYTLPPIKIWYGGTETGSTTNPAVEKQYAIDLVTAIQNSGGMAYYREIAGGGHDLSYGASQIINAEYMCFTERYCRSYKTYYQ